MKALTFAIRSFGRELRSGEVVVLLSAVILAVAALTAVGFLTDRIGKAVERQANEVLAADLRLRSQEPIPDAWRKMAAEPSQKSPGVRRQSRPLVPAAFGFNGRPPSVRLDIGAAPVPTAACDRFCFRSACCCSPLPPPRPGEVCQSRGRRAHRFGEVVALRGIFILR